MVYSITKLTEMPHYNVNNKLYDLQLENHIYDTAEEFTRYIKNLVDDKQFARRLLKDGVLQSFCMKYYDSGVWFEIKSYLESL